MPRHCKKVRNMKMFGPLAKMFCDEQSAIDHFKSVRWKDGQFCPHCKSDRLYHLANNREHKCADCKARFSIKVGTIFEGTGLPLRKWLHAIFVLTDRTEGITTHKLAKEIGVTQTTAWRIMHVLDNAARTRSFNESLNTNGASREGVHSL